MAPMPHETSVKISVIVPSFQQRDYLRDCLQGIVDAGAPKLELIVVDGGSTDGSVDVIREFESSIAWWVSEKDAGQTDAINKGLRRATGDVFAYVNSDDLLEPGALAEVGKFFQQNPSAEWLSGGCRVFGENVEEWRLDPVGVTNLREVLTPWDRRRPYVFPQSGACFMRRSVIDKIGYFDPTYHYSMDIEYYTRAVFLGKIQQHLTSDCLAAWRWHAEAKSFQKGIAYAFREDEIRIAETYAEFLEAADRKLLHQELRTQHRDLLLRKALWNHRQGNTEIACSLLWDTVREFPMSIASRPWLGALKRIVLGKRG
jgi:GT2 family glycosyltransferase